jgi:hypothetical protein
MSNHDADLVMAALAIRELRTVVADLDRIVNAIVVPGIRDINEGMRKLESLFADKAELGKIDLGAAMRIAEEIRQSAPPDTEFDITQVAQDILEGSKKGNE